MRLVALSAALEIAVGLGLIVLPQVVGNLLLGTPLDAAGVAAARVGGAALLSLGLTCWFSSPEPPQAGPVLGLLTYNLLVALYLAGLGLTGGPTGPLLWPTVALHGVLALLLLRERSFKRFIRSA